MPALLIGSARAHESGEGNSALSEETKAVCVEEPDGVEPPTNPPGLSTDLRKEADAPIEPRYCGFISYSHTDRKFATWLHRRLESFQIPKEFRGHSTTQGSVLDRLGRFYRDEAEEGAASDLGKRIELALASSGCLLVVCSPASSQSKWVNKEISRYKELGRSHRIFLIVVAGILYSGDPATECFPPSLIEDRGPSTESGMDQAEPLAVDVRHFGREDALLRIVSGILDLRYDDLKQRELVRQRKLARRNALLATFGLTLAAAAIVAALFALNQRSHALYALAQSRASE